MSSKIEYPATSTLLVRSSRVVRQLSVLILVGLLTGCGSPHEAQVSGQVTLDGTLLTKGNVAFIPISDGTVAYGTIQSDGSYHVQTADDLGLAPGTYKVTVVATDPPPVDDGSTTGKLLTPALYGNRDTTPLEEVVSSGPNQIDLKLQQQ